MSTKNAASDTGMDEVDTNIVEGLKREMSLSVIERPGAEMALPALPIVTDFEVAETAGEDGAPFDLSLNEHTGLMSLTINQEAIIHQMCFGVLKIKDGPRKGEVITKEMVDEEIKRMKDLLEKDDLFADGVADEYRDAKTFAAKINTSFNDFKVEKKTPINRLGNAIQGIPVAALGEFVPLRQSVLDKLKNHKIEAEKREREAAAKYNLWREKTADKMLEIASLPGKMINYDALQVESAAALLLAEKFTPHPDEADRYAETYDQTTQALAAMYGDKLKAEEAAALEAEESAKKYAAEQAELEELRAGKIEQGLKDDAAAHLAHVNELFSKCVGAESKLIAGYVASVNFELEVAAENKHFDTSAASGIKAKMHGLLVDAKQKEADAAAAVKEEADRVAREAAEKEEKEGREKAEAAAALEKANQELLLGSGFTFDGKAYTKGGYLIRADKAKLSSGRDISIFIADTDRKIAVNEAAAKKAEEDYTEACNIAKAYLKFEIGNKISSKWASVSSGAQITIGLGEPDLAYKVNQFIEKEKAAAEKAAAEKEAARKSYALKVKEMTAAINNCEDHEAVVEAILADEIPHVRFVTD